MWAPRGRYGLSPSKSIFLYARSASVSERSERLVVCVPPRPMSGDEHSMARGGHSSQLVHHANADPLHGYTGATTLCGTLSRGSAVLLDTTARRRFSSRRGHGHGQTLEARLRWNRPASITGSAVHPPIPWSTETLSSRIPRGVRGSMLAQTLMVQRQQGLQSASTADIPLGFFLEVVGSPLPLRHSVVGGLRLWIGSGVRSTPLQRAILRLERRVTGGKLLF